MLAFEVVLHLIDDGDRRRLSLFGVVHAIDVVICRVSKKKFHFTDGDRERVLIRGSRGFHFDEVLLIVGEFHVDVVRSTRFVGVIHPLDFAIRIFVLEIVEDEPFTLPACDRIGVTTHGKIWSTSSEPIEQCRC